MKSSSSWKWNGGGVVLTLALNDRLIFPCYSCTHFFSVQFCFCKDIISKYVFFMCIKISVFLYNYEKRLVDCLPIIIKENRCFVKREKYKNLMQYQKLKGILTSTKK